jgi:hypothetical protein
MGHYLYQEILNYVPDHLFIHFKKAYDTIKQEVLYNILTEFGRPMKQITLIKIFITTALQLCFQICY